MEQVRAAVKRHLQPEPVRRANILGFAGNLSMPITSNFDVARIDHDFGSKNHFMASYRYYKIKLASDSEVDIGGFFPGDTWARRPPNPAIRFKTGTWLRV